jgi:hypothetical protein
MSLSLRNLLGSLTGRGSRRQSSRAKPARKRCNVRLELEALEDRCVPAIVWPPSQGVAGMYDVAFTPQFGPETIVNGSTNDGMQHPGVNLIFSGPYWNTQQGQQDETAMIAATQSILGGPYLNGRLHQELE